ncbi:MAG TPA: glycoside hydrolase family 15 protein [Gemmataceae bacterium]|jgi:GH15 family glucan-1,4-alpha-glucosidase|nr:glycoside hydrolase family 15 protein [Gemmataceae bacterium]
MTANPKIQDYAVIGSGRSAALVSRHGYIDWLCWPRFDSPSLFGRLLDLRAGGSWSIAPAEPAEVERRYIDATNVLRTRFRTGSGVVSLTDFMPAASEEEKRRMLWPEHELVRRVECELGEVEVRAHFDPRPDYGRAKVTLRDAGVLGVRIEMGARLITLRSDVKLAPAAAGGVSGTVRLKAGEAVAFSLTDAWEGPAVLPPLGDLILQKLALTVGWWQRWAARASYTGPYRDQVVRSALALKLLTYAPSGAMIAAPTTSLPERVGGDLNWDYRFCWLRDAAFTARALFGLGYREDAEAFVSWMLHATRLTRPELRVIYDVFGESNPAETELPHLRGYAGSSPVRVGNATRDQLQLDVYGEVVEAVTHFLRSGGELDRETQAMLRHFGGYVCRHWREPDNGIWEPRDKRQHYTHSRLLCWVALDRLLGMHRLGRLGGIPVEDFTKHRDEIRRDIEDRGWNPALESYTQVLGGNTLDATVLLLAFLGFDQASSPRMRLTFERIRGKLGGGPGLLYRYEQSFAGGEGAFALCSFWIADFLARGGGTPEEAHRAFAATAAYANDVGLFAEEIDPKTGDALGNFPQAFTHVGLINAALSLAERDERERHLVNGRQRTAPAAGGGEPRPEVHR